MSKRHDRAGRVVTLSAGEPGREPVLSIPEPSMVVLVGASGSGKSTFAARHFLATEVLNSDRFRGIVGDNETDQSVTQEAFEALHFIADLRLKLGRLTVVDATNVKPQDRAHLVHLAHTQHVPAVAVVLNVPAAVCIERDAVRTDRQVGARVVRNHVMQLRSGLRGLEREGFRVAYVLGSPAAIDAARVVRTPLAPNRAQERGPFDIIGDVHGCFEELCELLQQLGYAPDAEGVWRHAEGRRAIFVGDLVDRGPGVVKAVQLVQRMVAAGQAFCLPGNHDDKLLRHLNGAKVRITHGLGQSMEQIESLPHAERADWIIGYRGLFGDLPSHLVLDGGALVVAHGGMKQEYQGRVGSPVRNFALYGDTTGETDEDGLPVRLNWAADYRGHAAVVYGHTPVAEPTWLNNTINIDTGCVFGGRLTALRWPERALVTVPAHQVYAESKRRLAHSAVPGSGSEVAPDTLLRIEDVVGKQIVATSLRGNVIVEADRAAVALEVMSRFAMDPRWLIYLPPTMSPGETSGQPGWLEHPAEVFAYFREQGVARVVCEEKHMGSRAVLVLCRDVAAAQRRFGAPPDSAPGACYTRTGRRFLDDDALDRDFITRLSDALGRAGFWECHSTDWVCLDAELLPWNAKAQGLIRDQYAPVAAAGEVALDAALAAAEAAAARGIAVGPLEERLRGRKEDIERYSVAYGHYCWDVKGLEGVRVAPFHLLATEGHVYTDRSHLWHMDELRQLASVDPIFMATAHREVDLADEAACAEATEWWAELTERGGEGMVVKPLDFVTQTKRGLCQPAVKCRGREYLRIIYGPHYSEQANLERLRRRALGGKRHLALREFALGVEALERFVRGEPLWRVHQAVFAVLALESEPVDPRL